MPKISEFEEGATRRCPSGTKPATLPDWHGSGADVKCEATCKTRWTRHCSCLSTARRAATS
eukprot:23507-Pyramimonas_sp.AAC.3